MLRDINKFARKHNLNVPGKCIFKQIKCCNAIGLLYNVFFVFCNKNGVGKNDNFIIKLCTKILLQYNQKVDSLLTGLNRRIYDCYFSLSL